MTSLLSLPPRLDIAAKFTTEARYAGFFDADNRYYGKYSTNYVFYCLSVLVNQQVVLTGNDSNLLIVFYVQIMPDDFVMQLHRF